MGRLNIMDPSGHVAIDWTPSTIDIDMVPDTGKATSAERKEIVTLVSEAMDCGFNAVVDGKELTKGEAIPKKAKKISMKMTGEAVQGLLEKILRTKVIANHVVFKVSEDGSAEIVKAEDIKASDKGEYQTTKPLSGG